VATSVPVREQAIVFRELATLIGAGVTITQALSDQLNRPLSYTFRYFLTQASERVSKGDKLSAVMRDNAQMFSEITIALVEAGEMSGRLDNMLRDIAEYLEREVELRNMIARETFYAKILICAALFIPLAARCIVTWLMVDFMSALGVFFQTILIYALLGGIPFLVLYLLYRRTTATETGKNTIDQIKLAVPGLGGIVERLALSKFARAFGTLYAAGVNVVRATPMAADTCGNRYYTNIIRLTVPRIEQGIPLSEALAGTRLTNSLLIRLLETGEQTGNIEEMMTKAAEHYESETHTRIRKLAVAVVPVVVILMGLIIGAMVIKFYTGLYGGM